MRDFFLVFRTAPARASSRGQSFPSSLRRSTPTFVQRLFFVAAMVRWRVASARRFHNVILPMTAKAGRRVVPKKIAKSGPQLTNMGGDNPQLQPDLIRPTHPSRMPLTAYLTASIQPISLLWYQGSVVALS